MSYKLTIAHLYPDLLNLYGDNGNILTLSRRCAWRGIEADIRRFELRDPIPFDELDIVFLGGGSDREQLIVCERLKEIQPQFKAYVEKGGVVAAVCGGYQLLGHFYQMAAQRIEGLHILDIETTAGKQRLIGNVAIACTLGGQTFPVVGFENHGGQTNIGSHTPLGKVMSGYGNNGTSGYEGVQYKNVIGTYVHGPLLPKNPPIADFLISQALKNKYPEFSRLAPLDDTVEITARNAMLDRLDVK